MNDDLPTRSSVQQTGDALAMLAVFVGVTPVTTMFVLLLTADLTQKWPELLAVSSVSFACVLTGIAAYLLGRSRLAPFLFKVAAIPIVAVTPLVFTYFGDPEVSVFWVGVLVLWLALLGSVRQKGGWTYFWDEYEKTLQDGPFAEAEISGEVVLDLEEEAVEERVEEAVEERRS